MYEKVKQYIAKIKEKMKITKPRTEKMLIIFMPLIIEFIIEVFFRINNGGWSALFGDFKLRAFIFSIFVLYMIYAILFSISKKNSTAIKIISIISYIFLVVNQVKILYTDEPLVFSDFNFLSKFGEIATLTYSTMVSKIFPKLIGFIILGFIFFVIVRWSKQHEKVNENTKMRVIVSVVCICIMLILFIPSKYTKNAYLNLVFQANKYTDYNSYTTNLSYYKKYTVLSGLWGVMLNNTFTEPENYDNNKLDEILKIASESNTEKENWGKPNIILVFSEAFWNIDKLEEVKFSPNVTKNIAEMKENGATVNLLSCSYGGMSENVSFELLTGTSMNYFPNGYIPIMSLYKRENIAKAPSIVRELNKNGYDSKIVFGRDYYNSEKAFKKLGFLEYKELVEKDENKKGYFISDKYMMDEIIQELQNKQENQPIFYMAETIQNHMPYTIDKYREYDVTIEKSNMDEDINNTLLAYAQGAYDAATEVNRLYEFIKQYKEPTILIFLGDHLPYLYTSEGKDATQYLEYFNTSDELENTYRKYDTQALVMSNYEINYEKIPNYLGDDLLITYIVNQMDIELDDYYKWLYTTISELPGVNKHLYFDAEGKKYWLSDMNDKRREIYDLKEKLLYKFFIENTK